MQQKQFGKYLRFLSTPKTKKKKSFQTNFTSGIIMSPNLPKLANLFMEGKSMEIQNS